jgi:hypothetical protein
MPTSLASKNGIIISIDIVLVIRVSSKRRRRHQLLYIITSFFLWRLHQPLLYVHTRTSASSTSTSKSKSTFTLSTHTCSDSWLVLVRHFTMYLRRPNKNNHDATRTCSLSSNVSSSSSSKLFQPGTKIIVQRAPLFAGLSVPNAILHKKFQRPMLKRRAYGRDSDDALRRSSLGQRKRMDGMAKLMARAGKGLTFSASQKLDATGDEDQDDQENKAESDNNNKPYEPLLLWCSPRVHQDVEPKGLPPKM